MSNFERELTYYIKAGIPVLSISTYEWQRLHSYCVKVAHELERDLYTWGQVSGLSKWNDSEKTWVEEADKRDPIDALEWFKEKEGNLILLLEDFHPFLTSEQHPILRHLREITRLDTAVQKTLLIQGIQMLQSEDLAKEVPSLTLSSPDHETLCVIIENVTRSLAFDYKPSDEDEKNEIASASLGMGSVEAEWTYKKIIAEKSRLTYSEIPLIIQEKEHIIKKGGILEYYHPESDFSSVGGMENLKVWLKQRGKAFTQDAKHFGLVAPKGVMLLGIPGCGKSLLAKTISNEWELPLLKFDLGKVFGGIVGESEANIRKALSLAETIAPSILWIDEIEKGLSGLSGAGDSGTSSRVFGHLLTWMQDKKSDVFVVATANNIEQLPPELLRKGRFDEIFFVDLPSGKEREEILRIHIQKTKRDVLSFDLNTLVKASVGFSGAELEEAVTEGMFAAYHKGIELGTMHIEQAIKKTYPLSKTMRESIEKLKTWASVRARFASEKHDEKIPQDSSEMPILKQEKSNPFI